MLRVVVVVGLVLFPACEASVNGTRRMINHVVSPIAPIDITTNVTHVDPRVANKGKELRRLCSRTLQGLLKYCDLIGSNCDWLFYVTGSNQGAWHYPSEIGEIDTALLEGYIPQGIKPLDLAERQAIIQDLCTWLSEVHVITALSYDFYSLRPYTLKGVLRMTALNVLLRPYNYVPAEYSPLVSKCASHLRGLIKHYRRRHVDDDELVMNILGFNPYFSEKKWCTLGLNHVERRMELTRRRYRQEKEQNTSQPVYDFSVVAVNDPRVFNKLLSDVSTKELEAILMEAGLNLDM